MKAILILLLLTCPLIAQDEKCWYNYRYVKLGAAILNPTEDSPRVGATMGGGMRVLTGHSGVDLSFDYLEGGNKSHIILGKGLYIFTLTPNKGRSFYAGGGLGYGKSKLEERSFTGIFGEGAVGYALITHRKVLAFIELGVHQPAISTDDQKDTHYKTAISLTFGVGF